MSLQRLKRITGVPPLVLTCYAESGRVLARFHGLRGGQGVNIPKDIRKRVARTEVMDARGEIIDTWHAPWAVEHG